MALISADPQLEFKLDSLRVQLLVQDNISNLDPDFIRMRAQGLTEAEKAVVIGAQFVDTETAERFLPSIALWDACQEPLPALTRHEQIVLALDAGVSRDSFALVGVTRHPDPARKKTTGAVRLVRQWLPSGKPLDYGPIEAEITAIIKDREHFNVVQVCYDMYQLHQMAGNLGKFVWAKVFSQGTDRLVADKALLDAIFARTIVHDGNNILRQAIDNADRQTDAAGDNRLRIVKRADHLKVDPAVALSMALSRCMHLNLG